MVKSTQSLLFLLESMQLPFAAVTTNGVPAPPPSPADEEQVDRLQRFVLGGSFMSNAIKPGECPKFQVMR